MKRSFVSTPLLILSVLLVATCSQTPSAQGPTTWLDDPLDGARLPVGPMEIVAHASDSDGIASFDFYVDGTLLAHAQAVASAPVHIYSTGYSGAPGTAGYLASATVGWHPTTPGVYSISARATDSQGNPGPDATALVTVGEVDASPTPTLVPTGEMVTGETPSPEPPTVAPMVATWTPPPPGVTPMVPTWTPKPPTATPKPLARRPEIAYFEVNPSTINQGGCSTLRWGVDYAAEVYLDGQGVTDHETRQVCPPSTTTYTLYARSPGGEQSASATVTVIHIQQATPTFTSEPITPTPIVTYEIPDFDAPYVTNPEANPGSIKASSTDCTGGQTTVSIFADDPSGVAGVVAYWWLGSKYGESNLAPKGGGRYEAVMGPFDTTGTLQVWFVARDTVGNSSDPPVGPIYVDVDAYCIG